MKKFENISVVEELLKMVAVWLLAFFVLGMWSQNNGVQLKMIDYIWWVTPLAIVSPLLFILCEELVKAFRKYNVKSFLSSIFEV